MSPLVLVVWLGFASAAEPDGSPAEGAPTTTAPAAPGGPLGSAGAAPEDPLGSAPTEPDEIAPESNAPTTFADVLADAKQLYFQGQASQALERLRTLQVRLLMSPGEATAAETAETLLWSGEIQYQLGDAEEARKAFRWLLERDPEYPISPYAHPMEVVGEFELVRREVLAELARQPGSLEQPPIVEPSPPVPAWAWAPLGIPQFAERRVGAGLLFGGLQIGLGAASLGVAAHLRFVNTGPTAENELAPHPLGWDADEVARKVSERRYLAQWPLTFAAYGTWLASTIEARRYWRRTHAPGTTVGAGPLPGGGSGVVLAGQF